VNQSQAPDKAQPRRLSRQDPAQPCSWADCSAKALGEHKDKGYCASHLLKVLQQQWQG